MVREALASIGGREAIVRAVIREGMSLEQLLDRPGAVRPGEELDPAVVAEYLKSTESPYQGVPELFQFPGGASNLTYLLRYPAGQLILRRGPFGHKAKSAHDMVREARVMHALKKSYPYVPKIVAICEDEAVLGSPFYVMERVPGVILRRDLPDGLTLTSDEARVLCLSVIDRLIALHQLDYAAAGLAHLGKGEGYVERQITGWIDRYSRARTEDVPDFKDVIRWLSDNRPAREVAISVVHNDYRFDNVVLDPNDSLRVISVLDWEMATLGDPWMDLGNTLAYWVEAGDEAPRQSMRGQPTNLPGMLTRDEVVAYYSQKTGQSVDNFGFYYVYGLFRLAGILQQIYYRYFNGQTQNPRFAAFGGSVKYLESVCLKAMK
jgi:aminoglycoside phosphotransferase (APT) family kinase protein